MRNTATTATTTARVWRFLHENATAAATAIVEERSKHDDDNNKDTGSSGSSSSDGGGSSNDNNNNAEVDTTTVVFHKMLALTQETTFERTMDILLALAFLGIAIMAARRMQWSRQQMSTSTTTSTASQASTSSASSSSTASPAETTVVTAFYALILLTSVLRALWFGIPNSIWQPSYTPVAVYAFDTRYPSWWGAFLSQLVATAGSLALLSIFILILVYWADILKKYFYPGARRSRPMTTFVTLVVTLSAVEGLNLLLFLVGLYTTEAMILYDAIVLATVSIVCVCQITIFSQRFRTVLKTLGAINQVSTDAQVRRIVWITVTGNLFFFTRALLEAIFALVVLTYWMDHHSVAKLFTHVWWDTYVLLKYSSEVAILALMLYILQSRFASQSFGQAQVPSAASRRAPKAGYPSIPESNETTPLVQSADV